MKTSRIIYACTCLIAFACDRLEEVTPLKQDAENENARSVGIAAFTPIPANIVAGYWENWQTAAFIPLRDVPSSYNVVIVAFITFANDDGYTAEFNLEGYDDEQDFIDDINLLKSRGVPVMVSVGGENDFLNLQTNAQRDIFVNNVIDIIDHYGFDGLDIDLEGSSLSLLEPSDITNFPVPTSAKMIRTIQAFKSIHDNYSAEFLMMATPEAYFLQRGYSAFNAATEEGAFNVLLENLRTRLTWVNPQLYNTGTMFGTNNVEYAQGTKNFVLAMTDMMLTGYPLAGTNDFLTRISQPKMTVALPACRGTEDDGYLTPAELTAVLNYLRTGVENDPEITYNLNGRSYPNLKGVVFWSINTDHLCGDYASSEAMADYFNL